MSQCFADVTFGQFPVGDVTLTFVSSVDGSQHQATGTVTVTDLTILAADLPQFTSGVGYKVTSDVDWTLGGTVRSCVSIRFVVRKDANGLVSGTSETVTVC
jgi:hypothetical protein